MEKIIVGFSKPINRVWFFGYIFSWLIRLIDNAKYSHAYIQWPSSWLQRDVVYQASGSSVHFIVGHKFKKIAKTVYEYEIECSKETKAKVIRKAMDHSSDSYGLKQIFGIFIVKIARLFGKDIKNPFSDSSATWVCSEIVMNLLSELEINIPVHRDNITPKDIQKFLDNLSKQPDSKVKLKT